MLDGAMAVMDNVANPARLWYTLNNPAFEGAGGRTIPPYPLRWFLQKGELLSYAMLGPTSHISLRIVANPTARDWYTQKSPTGVPGHEEKITLLGPS